jgi:hypothetical protein
MNCEEARAGYLAGDDDERIALHMEGCAACRSRVAALAAARTSLSDPALWEEPSPQLADQVIGLIAGSPRAETDAPRRWAVPVLVAAMLVAVAALGVTSILAAPDWEVDIPGTEIAPQASATVSGWNTDTGTRMRLETAGLDEAPEGYVYEFWMSEGPLHVSAGTFRSAGEVDLWAGVRRADYPRLWITLEKVGDYAGPSSHTVLDVVSLQGE